ncbi:MAG: hypothetical protein HY779_04025 [Rubrobacteridae bacterium]|nr:hypothetical protein [Rubrobacteridae bacterium]
MNDEQMQAKSVEKTFDVVLSRIYYGLGTALLVCIIAFNVVSSFDVIPRFCGQCHKTTYSIWSESKHSKVKCRVCHNGPNVFGKIIRKNLLITSHKEFLEAGYECSNCHSSSIHGTSSSFQTQTTMEKCLACHNNVTASGKCEVCHTKVQVVMRSREFVGPLQTTHGKS